MAKIPHSKSSAILVFILITGCAAAIQRIDFETLYGPSSPRERLLDRDEIKSRQKQNFVSYHNDVKPIIDSRCVACHSCYDAPCQLKLSSFEGLDRGASKEKVYNARRLEPTAPTRLFTDAANTSEWRKESFYPVLNERTDSAVAALDNSVLAKLLQLKHDHPLPENEKLSEDFDLAINRDQECPTIDEFAEYHNERPLWGMPYAMPGLNLQEEFTILKWLREGAKIEPRPEPSIKAQKTLSKWESFFNRSSLKNRLVSRYIYEHLFIGHLHFQGHPDDEFYQLVRSTTPFGEPIKEIATIRPYDEPGVKNFYYRLRPVVSTIVDKTHFVYELSDQKMLRYDELFFQPDYSVKSLPSYQTEHASNPFKTYIDIPVTSRYKFLLDNAEYFVAGFIKGPVCRGQIALNVIRDQFWVVFIKPGLEYADKGAQFLAENTPVLALPGEAGDDIGLFDWRKYDEFGEKYLKQKEAFISQAILNKKDLDLNFIWDGDGKNQNAALTIFRHWDSATVVTGFVGDTPLTGWIIDYPVFERIHYLLVAGFNVYGPVGHQLATRKYMDYLRMDGENNFLRFMPAKRRQILHDNWYKGIGAQIFNFTTPPLFSIDHETAVPYKTAYHKREFFNMIRKKMNKAAGRPDTINGCKKRSCFTAGSSSTQQEVERLIREMANLKGKRLQALPEVSFLRIRTENSKEDLAYTLLLNKAYSNIAFIIADSYRREPENDDLTIVPGFIGSYPNFFFSVEKDKLRDFIEHLKNADTDAGREFFFRQYGIRRSNPEIWEYYDWFNQRYKKDQGRFAGIFDMSRYQNL